MQVRIMMKDKTVKQIENAVKVTNASTNIEHDWLYIYMPYDRAGYPTHRICMDNVTCVEVVERRF